MAMLGGMDHQRPRYYCGMRGFFRPGMSVSTAVDGISVNKGIDHFFASGIGKNPMGQKRAALMPPMDPSIASYGPFNFCFREDSFCSREDGGFGFRENFWEFREDSFCFREYFWKFREHGDFGVFHCIS